MFKVIIHITRKPGVLDPQGKTVQNSLKSMGFCGIDQLRIGKFIELVIDESDLEKAKQTVNNMCRQLLANTVIENFTIDVK